VVGVLIRMKLAVLRRSMSGQRAASMLAGGSIGLLLAAGTLLVGFSHFGSPDTEVAVLSLLLMVWTLGWLFGPMLTGGDAVLRLEYFTLLPIRPRKLAAGMVGAGFVGITPVVALVAFAVLIVYGAHLGLVAALVAIPALLLQLWFVVVLSKAGMQALGRLVRSRFGWELSSLVVGFVLGLQNTGWMDIGLAIRTFSGGWADGGGVILRILPSSWAVLAVDAAGKGDWGIVALTLGGLAVLGALLFFVFAALLSRQLVRGLSDGGATQTGGDSPASKRVLPGGPFGGVLGKELRMWVRDLRRARFLSMALWAGLFSGLFPLLDGNTVMLPFAGVITALFAGALSANVYGLDAGALWLTLVTPSAERADVRARQAAWLLVVAVPVLVLTALLTLVSGQGWAWVWVLAVLPAMLGAAAGLVPLVSLVGVAPFQDRPGGNPMDGFTDESGDQVRLKIFGMLFGQILLAAPAAAVVLIGFRAGNATLEWLGVVAGIVLGAGYAWLFGRLAHRRLETAGPEILDLMRKGVRAEVKLSGEETDEEPEAEKKDDLSGGQNALVALFVLIGILLVIPQGLVSLALSLFGAPLPGWFFVDHVPAGLRVLTALGSIVLGLCSFGVVVLMHRVAKRRREALEESSESEVDTEREHAEVG
jgi:ABC-2 type transport system permease protein